MATYERETAVNTSPDKAFAYLLDISRHPEWAQHRLEIEKESPGDVAVGSKFRTVGHEMGTHSAVVTVTELVPDQKLTYEAEDDTGRFRHWLAVSQRDGQTIVTKGVEPLRLSLLLKLISPLMGMMVPRSLDKDLDRIKAKLEGAAPAAETPMAQPAATPSEPPSGPAESEPQEAEAAPEETEEGA